jgi:RNA polymerase sigma-70 factor, ECF subfamily
MPTPSPEEVTQLLMAWSEGDQSAFEKLVPLVEAELHRLAKHYMQRERSDHTLQTTALVNEAYLRLADWKNARWQNRAHFFGVSARLMRNILVDYATAHRAAKRGGDNCKLSLSKADGLIQERDLEILALDDALKRLALIDERKSRIVELRYFGGLTTQETAEVLGISDATVEREWTKARAWLYRELSQDPC